MSKDFEDLVRSLVKCEPLNIPYEKVYGVNYKQGLEEQWHRIQVSINVVRRLHGEKTSKHKNCNVCKELEVI